jgi:hypothetical protein
MSAVAIATLARTHHLRVLAVAHLHAREVEARVVLGAQPHQPVVAVALRPARPLAHVVVARRELRRVWPRVVPPVHAGQLLEPAPPRRENASHSPHSPPSTSTTSEGLRAVRSLTARSKVYTCRNVTSEGGASRRQLGFWERCIGEVGAWGSIGVTIVSSRLDHFTWGSEHFTSQVIILRTRVATPVEGAHTRWRVQPVRSGP